MILKKAFKGIKLPAPQRFYHSSKKYLDKPLSNESHHHENETVYEAQMYENWKKDHSCVHSSWNNYFTDLENGDLTTATRPRKTGDQTFQAEITAPGVAVTDAVEAAKESLRIRELILTLLNRGHERADLDPLRNT